MNEHVSRIILPSSITEFEMLKLEITDLEQIPEACEKEAET